MGIADFMITRGDDQRIERLWRDVCGGCTVLYYKLFYYIEEEGMLDPDDSVHLFCLHYNYISAMN